MSRATAGGFAVLAALLVVGLLGPACGGPSEEDRIREVIGKAAARAEKRDVEGLMRFLTADYVDGKGRDREATARLVAGYFERYRGVVVHVLGARVGEIAPDGRASVEFEIALSHGAAEMLRKLIRWGGETYRFEADMRKDERGEWRLAYADWDEIALAGLFPESLAVLKELFPGL
jgi:ketosteroid isomerase-like protein